MEILALKTDIKKSKIFPFDDILAQLVTESDMDVLGQKTGQLDVSFLQLDISLSRGSGEINVDQCFDVDDKEE